MPLNLLQGSNPAYQHLDWEGIIGPLSSLARFDYTRELMPKHPSYRPAAEIEAGLESLDFFVRIADDPGQLQDILHSIPDSSEHFRAIARLEKAHVLDMQQLNFAALLLEAYQGLATPLRGWAPIASFEISPEAWRHLRTRFLNPLRIFVERDGKVNYARHPELSKVHEQLVRLEKGLREAIQQVARTDLYAKALQFSEHDVINDRYVLALRSDSYRADHGPIVGRSNSGMTLFVEPPELRERSNLRLRLMAQIEEILARLCVEFSALLHPYHREMRGLRDLVAETDAYLARALYCARHELVRPELSTDFEISIQGFFHPLVKDPVRNSIELDTRHKGLVISGPNTGGKTVALKAIALCELFLHYGLFVPAYSARLYPVEGVYYFGNDQQDLSQGLSSFASETKNYLLLLEELQGSNLIVVDEIFNSTSSEEASALALALLDTLHVQSESKVLISTHHQFFKTAMHSRNDYLSAHMAYDHEKHAPTYKLEIGHPGGSMAFEIFARLAGQLGSVGRDIAARAHGILGGKQLSYEQLLAELSRKKSDLDRMMMENRSLNADLRNQKKSAEGLIRLEKDDIIAAYKRKMEGLLEEAQKIVDAARKKEITTPRQLQQRSGSLKSLILREESALAPTPGDDAPEGLVPLPSLDDYVVGETYYSTLMKKDVVLTSVDKRKATGTISSQKINMRVPMDTLLAHRNRVAYKRPPPSPPKQEVQINVLREVAGKLEIDCRGMRLDEFQRAMDRALTELVAGDIPFLNVIHGHGEGVLKKWLRDHLNREKKTFRWENDVGNDGSTRITLA